MSLSIRLLRRLAWVGSCTYKQWVYASAVSAAADGPGHDPRRGFRWDLRAGNARGRMERDRHLDEARAAGAAAAQLRRGARAEIGSAAGPLITAEVQRLAANHRVEAPPSAAIEAAAIPSALAVAPNVVFPTEQLTELVVLSGRTRAQVARQFGDLVEQHGWSAATAILAGALEVARSRPAPVPLELVPLEPRPAPEPEAEYPPSCAAPAESSAAGAGMAEAAPDRVATKEGKAEERHRRSMVLLLKKDLGIDVDAGDAIPPDRGGRRNPDSPKQRMLALASRYGLSDAVAKKSWQALLTEAKERASDR